MEGYHREKEGLFSQERQQLLMKYQLKCYRAGYKPMNLSTNMYGFVVNCYMRANIQGGRASLTRRGLTLEQALREGLEMVEEGSNATLEVSLRLLPSEIKEMILRGA